MDLTKTHGSIAGIVAYCRDIWKSEPRTPIRIYYAPHTAPLAVTRFRYCKPGCRSLVIKGGTYGECLFRLLGYKGTCNPTTKLIVVEEEWCILSVKLAHKTTKPNFRLLKTYRVS